MDDSIINYVKNLSLNEVRSNSDYKYDQIKIKVDTIPNNGIVKTPFGNINNACFFIAVAQGIKRFVEKETVVDPFQVMQIARFTDYGQMVDTSNKEHAKAINTLVDELQICLCLYIGKMDEQTGQWYATPDPDVCFGAQYPEIVIRILNTGKHLHFAYIITDDKYFVYEPKMKNEEAGRIQSMILEQCQFDNARDKYNQQNWKKSTMQ